MAIFLELDKAQYLNGQITLFRGDDWSLVGRVRNSLPGNYFEDVDLTGVSATGFFPTDPSITTVPQIAALIQITNAKCGEFTMSLPASGSPSGQLTPNGSSIYMQTTQSNGTTVTYQTNDSPINIQDRVFQQF